MDAHGEHFSLEMLWSELTLRRGAIAVRSTGTLGGMRPANSAPAIRFHKLMEVSDAPALPRSEQPRAKPAHRPDCRTARGNGSLPGEDPRCSLLRARAGRRYREPCDSAPRPPGDRPRCRQRADRNR